jgi:putative heme-binding domain-containing protein
MSHPHRACVFAFLCLAYWCPWCPGEESHGLRVPPGFVVTEFADSKLANDIFCMTLDPRGRVVVSGSGYIRILVDDKGNGRAERAIDLAGAPRDGAQGLLWEGNHLYFTGDGGLRRFHVKNDKTDGPSELIRAVKTGGEHDAHAIKRGPDGWLYLLCGNFSGIDERFAQLPTSPIKEPVAGCILRFTPDVQKSEIVADGFRNAYDMDFGPDDELFTFDSDNERCVSLPWYEPTRFYHVIAGGHHGWQAPQRAQWWRLPPYAADVVAPVAPMGRGSPTGVVCYRHSQFPEAYRGGFFLADWTFGRIWFVSLKRAGATYACKKEVFLQAVGDNGFAPTAMAVHPATGDLYISIGGRGTRGAVYRIRHTKGFQALDKSAPAQPRLTPRSLDWQPSLLRDLPRRARSDDALQRLRALVDLRRHHDHFDAEAIGNAIRANWDHTDRYVRKAAADLIGTLDEDRRRTLGIAARTPPQQTTFCLASYDRDPADVITRTSGVLSAKESPVESRLSAVRLMQLALGDVSAPKLKGTVWEGYSPRRSDLVKEQTAVVAKALRASFPTGDANLDREVSRTLAMIQDDAPDLPAKMAARLTDTSDPIEDIHYLIVLARLRGSYTSPLTDKVARALLALDRKLTRLQRNRDAHWPLRLGELHAEMSRKDAKLNGSLLASNDFGRPAHALFASAPGFDRRRAAEIFLARAAKDDDYPWSPALVRIIGSLPEDKSLPVLRRLWDHGGLEEAILPLLAKKPQAADREKFLQGLNSPRLATVRLCLDALEKLPDGNNDGQLLALVRALRALPDGREESQLRERIAKHLRKVTGQEKLGADKQAWTTWLTKAHPKLAAKLGGPDGVDVASWNKRLSKVDWSMGNADRGRAVFTKASCASCHSGAQALGPDLRGVAGRFSRDDLFTAILQPSKDISPRYRTTLVATASGKTYQGIVIYEAVDSLLLQTGPATTARIVNTQIVSRRVTDTSLMPPGLLDKFADRDIADLYAYLKSLRAGK